MIITAKEANKIFHEHEVNPEEVKNKEVNDFMEMAEAKIKQHAVYGESFCYLYKDSFSYYQEACKMLRDLQYDAKCTQFGIMVKWGDSTVGNK
jgi:hypothetical protein